MTIKNNMHIIILILLVVLIGLSWYVVKNMLGSKQSQIKPCPIFLSGPERCLNKISKINSVAENAKSGAVVTIDGGTPLYLKNVDAWPKSIVDKRVSVVGLLKRERYIPVATTDSNGLTSQGTGSDSRGQFVLYDAKYELSSESDPRQVSQNQKIKVDPSAYVIFSADKKIAFGFDTKSWWTPTLSDVGNAESLIQGCLSKEYPNILAKLEKYKRQYVGFIDDSGQKKMWVNFFTLMDESYNWKKDIYMVLDGGDNYFNLTFDLESNQCKDIKVNGEA
jgi:hypothetical protein